MNNQSETSGNTPVFFFSGAPPASTNRGVGALSASCIDQFSMRFSDSRLIVAGSGGAAQRPISFPDREVVVETSWLTGTTRLRTRSGARHLQWLNAVRRFLPGCGTRWLPNRTLLQLQDSNAFFDIAGGDSFSDIYGMATLLDQVAVKRLPIRLGKPLVLLPQTIGPFKADISKRLAREVLLEASLVATRDCGGLRELEDLLGKDLDDRFVRCPDVAFTLRPRELSVPSVMNMLSAKQLIGLNVSGLLWGAKKYFDSNSDYRALTAQIIDWILHKTSHRLLLVPHVFNRRPTEIERSSTTAAIVEDSDLSIATELHEELRKSHGDRVLMIDKPYDAAELKWIIGHCDFFIGARMHACIGAVSQYVPTVTLAYSKKAAGVMGMMDPSPPVIDLRSEDADSVITQIDRAFRNRSEIQQALSQQIPLIRARVQQFFQEIMPQKIGLSLKTSS